MHSSNSELKHLFFQELVERERERERESSQTHRDGTERESYSVTFYYLSYCDCCQGLKLVLESYKNMITFGREDT